MRTEDDLRAALRERADGSPPANVAALINGARLTSSNRPRRRLAVVSASAAVVMIALATPFIHRVTTHQTTTSGDTRGQPSASTLVAPTPQWVALTLIALIGGGGTVSDVGGHGGANYAADTFTFNDGHGASLVYITAAWPATNEAGGSTLTPSGCSDGSAVDSPGDIHWGSETLTCTTMADGTQLGIGRPRLPPSAGQVYGLALNNVSVLRPDGLEVTIGVFNQPTLPTSTSGPVVTTRADPPFTVGDLTSAALSNRWSTSVTAASVKAAHTLFPTVAPRTKTR